MTNVVFIPVRAGSRSIPNKNIRSFCGKPLLLWVVEAAANCEDVDQVVVATDSAEAKSIIENSALPKTTVYDRDAANAQDTSSTESVMLEYISATGLAQDATFILMQATTPATTSHDLQKSLQKFNKEGIDSLLTCARTFRFMWSEDGTPINYDVYNRPRRQDFDGMLVENGAIYINTVKNIQAEQNRLTGKIAIHEMPEYSLIEIDEEDDWEMAENVMRRNHPFFQ